jgi:hypothetical protein
MELSVELRANLRELASAGLVELRENGARVAPLSALSRGESAAMAKSRSCIFGRRSTISLVASLLVPTNPKNVLLWPQSGLGALDRTGSNLCALPSSVPRAIKTAKNFAVGLMHFARRNFRMTPSSHSQSTRISNTRFPETTRVAR